MFCKFCGQQIDGGANFCPRCGNRSAVPAPNYSYAPVQAASVQKPVNGLGIAAFVVGIVSLFLDFSFLSSPSRESYSEQSPSCAAHITV